MNLRELTNQFLEELQNSGDVRESTYRAYKSDLWDFIHWLREWVQFDSEPVGIDQIATPTITTFRAYMLDDARKKSSTINRRIITLKKFFGWALAKGYIQTNPAEAVKLLPSVTPPPRQLTDAEEARLVAAVQQHGTKRDYTMIVLMLHCGLRVTELVNVHVVDVEIKERSGVLHVRTGKRQKTRDIPLNITARKALQVYMATLPPDEKLLFPGTVMIERKHRTELLPLSQRAVGNMVTKYAYYAKVEDVSPHDLRHRFAYRMAKEVRLDELARLLGHQSINTTAIYTQPTVGDLQRGVDKIAWE